MHYKDKTNIFFGKLSDPGVLEKSPLAGSRPELQHFTSRNFQYIVDNIVDMFGLLQGTVQAQVVEQDHVRGWMDRNGNGRQEEDEIVLRFTMNAAINTYRRESYYGKYFMYTTAAQYGYPVIFGIAAHEVGHLMNRYALNTTQTQILRGVPCLVETRKVNDRWDELCADYLSGVVLAKAVPRLDQEPIKNFLAGTQADAMHPDGFWRVMAVEMGYRWGCANSPMLTSRILSDRNSLGQLLRSFFENYHQKIYYGVDARTRSRYSSLSYALMENCCIPLVQL